MGRLKLLSLGGGLRFYPFIYYLLTEIEKGQWGKIPKGVGFNTKGVPPTDENIQALVSCAFNGYDGSGEYQKNVVNVWRSRYNRGTLCSSRRPVYCSFRRNSNEAVISNDGSKELTLEEQWTVCVRYGINDPRWELHRTGWVKDG